VALDGAGNDDQQALGGDGADPVEGAADADERRLLVLSETEHVEAVGGDVVSRRTEGHQPEQADGVLEKPRRRDGQGHAGQHHADQRLRDQDPEALGLEHVHEGAPQGLDHPGQVEPARIQGDVGVGDAQPLVHDHRDGHDHDVWNGFG